MRILPTLAMVCCALQGAEPQFVQVLLERAARLDAIEARTGGVLGVAAMDLSSGRLVVARNAEAQFPQASSIKIPIMMEVFSQIDSGRLKLSQPVALQPVDSVGGSGHLYLLLKAGKPVTQTLEELITAMIVTSDNTATNKLIALVGMDSVNRMLDGIGLTKTRLRRIMLDGAAAERNDENVSTPLEMVRLMAALHGSKTKSAGTMLGILKGVTADLRAVVPPEVAVASKPGELTGVHCETGIVYLQGRPFAVSIASTFLDHGENPVRAVATEVYKHFEKLSRSNAYGNGGVR